MEPESVQTWLDAYVAAWRSYDAGLIADLFAEEATYACHPWDDPIRGRAAIVAEWLSARDEPESWEAEYRPFVVAEDRAVAIGETRYVNGEVFSNIWQLIFDKDGRCCEFVEWYMAPPAGQD